MANIDYSFENSIPIGPLKIAALDSCKDFAKKVDDYIVSFRQFDDFNSQGYFDYVITTNLNYRSPELLKRSWYIEADMSKFTAAIINTLNHDVPIGNSLSPTEKIQTLLKKHKEQFE